MIHVGVGLAAAAFAAGVGTLVWLIVKVAAMADPFLAATLTGSVAIGAAVSVIDWLTDRRSSRAD